MLTTCDIFVSLGGSQYFSKIDLSQAFNQIELSPESQRLTTINTPWGLFQYTRLCFGIANSPAIFQRCLDNALQGLSGVVSRVDDILIATATVEGHANLLKQVLEWLWWRQTKLVFKWQAIKRLRSRPVRVDAI